MSRQLRNRLLLAFLALLQVWHSALAQEFQEESKDQRRNTLEGLLRGLGIDAAKPSSLPATLVSSPNGVYGFSAVDRGWTLAGGQEDAQAANRISIRGDDAISASVRVVGNADLEERLSALFRCRFSLRNLVRVDNFRDRGGTSLFRLLFLLHTDIIEWRYFYNLKTPNESVLVALSIDFSPETDSESLGKWLASRYGEYLAVCGEAQRLSSQERPLPADQQPDDD